MHASISICYIQCLNEIPSPLTGPLMKTLSSDEYLCMTIPSRNFQRNKIRNRSNISIRSDGLELKRRLQGSAAREREKDITDGDVEGIGAKTIASTVVVWLI